MIGPSTDVCWPPTKVAAVNVARVVGLVKPLLSSLSRMTVRLGVVPLTERTCRVANALKPLEIARSWRPVPVPVAVTAAWFSITRPRPKPRSHISPLSENVQGALTERDCWNWPSSTLPTKATELIVVALLIVSARLERPQSVCSSASAGASSRPAPL